MFGGTILWKFPVSLNFWGVWTQSPCPAMGLLVVTALIAGIGFVGLGLSGSSWAIVFMVVVTAGFGLSRTPLYISYINKFIPSDQRATVLSVTSMARNIGIGLADLAAAAMVEWSVKHMMIISGAIIIFFALATRVKEEHLAD
jgi:sugar phosphate permease